MITARNYAAQAERDLKTFWMGTKAYDTELYADILQGLQKAVKFVMPDCGRVLNNGLKGLRGIAVDMPYDIFTVEYYEPGYKQLILVWKTESETAAFLFSKGDDPGCNWYPPQIGVLLPVDENGKIDVTKFDEIPISYKLCNKQQEDVKLDIKATVCACWSIWELLEAMSCRNVTTANHQDAYRDNAKRVKAGKLPIYETKMLVIDTKAKASGNGGHGCSHSSPRQHLRRGHIRRHPTAGNLWINSCVVGDPNKGVINKSYAVK